MGRRFAPVDQGSIKSPHYPISPYDRSLRIPYRISSRIRRSATKIGLRFGSANPDLFYARLCDLLDYTTSVTMTKDRYRLVRFPLDRGRVDFQATKPGEIHDETRNQLETDRRFVRSRSDRVSLGARVESGVEFDRKPTESRMRDQSQGNRTRDGELRSVLGFVTPRIE